MPFFYLRTQGFWQGFTLGMAPAQSPESCFVCGLNEEFFELLGDADFRLKAQLLLVSRYFEPRERVALLESLGMNAECGMRSAELQKEGQRLNEEGEEARGGRAGCPVLGPGGIAVQVYVCAYWALLHDD